MTVPVKAPAAGEIMEAVLLKGDLSKLTPEERTRYYTETCKSLGLNPLTKPFEYITLKGKLTLYARRDAADQLRKLNGISVEIVSQEMQDGLLTVHVRAKDSTGRTDEDLGVVAFPASLHGEDRANAVLKAVTKAKRRVTLSISGLGLLDETEVDDIPNKGPQLPSNGTGELLTFEELEDIWESAREIYATRPRDVTEEDYTKAWVQKLVRAVGYDELTEVPRRKYVDIVAKIKNFKAGLGS